MHILFVYVGLPLGGIETLLVRLSRQLSLSGVRVSVLFATRHADPGLLAQLRTHAKIAYLDEFIPAGPWSPIHDKPLLRFILPLKAAALKNWLQGTPDICHAADTGSLLLAARLQAASDIGLLTAGVYHDREYLFEEQDSSVFVNRSAALFKSLPARQVVFFNESSVRVHTQRFGVDYTASTLTPIGIDTDQLGASVLGRKSNRVVSIGRLTPFKTYNRYMVDTIARLRDDGLELKYDIYGTGECEPDLQRQIAQLSLQDQVQLKGPIAYADIPSALQGALAFVGSGTALIEASASGIPAIIGIEHAADAQTYGFLHDTKELSYHDAGLPYPKTTFDQCLAELSHGTDAAYAEHCQQAKLRARDFSIQRTASDFISLADHARLNQLGVVPIGPLESLGLNVSMLALRWRASRGRARFFNRHSNVTSS